MNTTAATPIRFAIAVFATVAIVLIASIGSAGAQSVLVMVTPTVEPPPPPTTTVPARNTSGLVAVDPGSIGPTVPAPGNIATIPTDPPEEVVLNDFTPEQPRPTRITGLRSTASPGVSSGVGFTTGGSPHGSPYQGPTDFKAGVGCSIQCITSGLAYARGVDAKLVVKTDTKASIQIFVFNDDGYYRVEASDAKTFEFGVVFDDLEGDTYYDAAVFAYDGTYGAWASGHFTTLQRNVEIGFTHANLSETPYGDDTFVITRWLEGNWFGDAYNGDPAGGVLPLGINIINVENTDQHLDLAVELAQQDESEDVCEPVWEHDEPASGPWPGSCAYLASAYLFDTDLDDRPNDANSWVEHSINAQLQLSDGNALPPGYGSPLNFTIPVSLHVTYTPAP